MRGGENSRSLGEGGRGGILEFFVVVVSTSWVAITACTLCFSAEMC